MPRKMDEELFHALTALLEWAAQMGGWEAPCWEQARKIADQYRDQQMTTAAGMPSQSKDNPIPRSSS